MQDEHLCLILDLFDGRKVNLQSHLKAKLNRFIFIGGLLWHQLPPCDTLRIYATHETDIKKKIIYELHDAPLSGNQGR